MKRLLFCCFALSAVGCAADEQLSQPACAGIEQEVAKSGFYTTKLSDKKFIELFADALELHRRYVHAPDSLLAEKKQLFKRYGITQVDIEKLLKDRWEHPEKWDAFIALIQQRFGEAAEREMKAFQKTKKKSEK